MSILLHSLYCSIVLMICMSVLSQDHVILITMILQEILVLSSIHISNLFFKKIAFTILCLLNWYLNFKIRLTEFTKSKNKNQQKEPPKPTTILTGVGSESRVPFRENWHLNNTELSNPVNINLFIIFISVSGVYNLQCRVFAHISFNLSPSILCSDTILFGIVYLKFVF